MSDEGLPEFEFYLTKNSMQALRDAGNTLLMQWQRSSTPTKQMLAMQRQLSDALDEFTPQVNDIMFGGGE